MELSFRQWFVIFLFSLICFASSCSYTLLATFFPFEVEKRNGNSVESGVVFGIGSVAAIFSSLITGTFVGRLGAHRLLCLSLIWKAFSVGIFGALAAITSNWLFITLAIILRISEGFASAGILLALFASAPPEFPNSVPLIYGVISMMHTIGFSIGPFLGEVLYEVGGFVCPFVFLGVFILCTGIFLPLISWSPSPAPFLEASETRRRGSMLKFLWRPFILLNFFLLFISSVLALFIVGIFPLFLRKSYGLKSGELWWAYGPLAVGNAISFPLWGFLMNLCLPAPVTMSTGGVIVLIASFLIGPPPIFGDAPNYTITCVGAGIFGFGISAIHLAILISARNEARNYGYPDTLTTAGLVLGGFLGVNALGSALGPILAGIFAHDVGFYSMTLTNFGISCLIVGLSLLYTGGEVIRKLCCFKPGSEVDLDENSKLLAQPLPAVEAVPVPLASPVPSSSYANPEASTPITPKAFTPTSFTPKASTPNKLTPSTSTSRLFKPISSSSTPTPSTPNQFTPTQSSPNPFNTPTPPETPPPVS